MPLTNGEQVVLIQSVESRPTVPVGSGDESEDNRFLRQMKRLISSFPAKSATILVAAISLIGGIGWWAAMLFRPPLNPEREAARAAYRSHGLPVPSTNDVVILIDTFSKNVDPKISVPEVQYPATNISGHWRYKCTALDRKYSHGGDAIIDTQVTPYGPQWRLTGTRQWREIDGQRVDGLNYTWSTDWAAFTERDRIKYTYRITTDRGAIIGFADGAITDRQNGIPVRIAGTFYQLPPLDPMYGEYEFSRD
jgi:hypothetical protein